MPTLPRTRAFVYGIRLWRLTGVLSLILLMSACARSPAKFNQQPWVWQQGPGNSDAIEKRQSTEPRHNVAEGQAQAISVKPADADVEVSGGNDRYTQAVRYGNMLYVSGQIPLGPNSLNIVGETAGEQAKVVMDNLQKILSNNGMTMSNIVSVTLYLKEINDLGVVDGIYNTYFSRALPARAVVAVSDLPRGSLLEISVVAGR